MTDTERMLKEIQKVMLPLHIDFSFYNAAPWQWVHINNWVSLDQLHQLVDAMEAAKSVAALEKK